MNLFLTATGTDIGKTYVAEALLNWDRQQDQCLIVSKPVMTGWPDSEKDIQHTDTGRLLKAQLLPCIAENIERITPWRFSQPLTPAMAASVENREMTFSDLLQFCQRRQQEAQQQNKIHLIEGVGGVMAPLTGSSTVLDWIQALQCPCVLITGSYLGTLSHTLTAVSVLQARKIDILAVVVSETANSSVPLLQTQACLKAFLPELSVVSLPYLPSCIENQAISSLYSLIQRGCYENTNV